MLGFVNQSFPEVESSAHTLGTLKPVKLFALQNDLFILQPKQDKSHMQNSCLLGRRIVLHIGNTRERSCLCEPVIIQYDHSV